MNDVIYSHKSDEWATPQDVFDALNDEFHFELDPCATSENRKCEKYFTLAENGLQKNWGGAKTFCNPPYSKIGEWVEKCYKESEHGTVVMLIPARTDTRWFHKYIYGKAEIRFVKGRIKFGGARNGAPFPSMIVIFRKDRV